MAVLKIEPQEGMPTVSGLQPDLEFVNQGDEVAAIGYPLGMDLLQITNETRITTSLSIGVVSRVSREVIQLNLRAYRGNSGGPALNRSGEVIGILTANIGDAQDIALATPIAAALDLIKDEVGY